MRRVFSILLLIPLLAGCGLFHHREKKRAAERAAESSKYDRLAAKAEAGDAKAARDLAKWCYMHDADNVRMKHWLGVAAKNGDHSAADLSEQVADWR